MNVTGKERYAVIPGRGRSATRSAASAGRTCRSTAQVMERIQSLPRTRELRAEPAMAPLAELRRRIGAQLSDEEFLLRATMPAEPGGRHAGAAGRRRVTTTRP